MHCANGQVVVLVLGMIPFFSLKLHENGLCLAKVQEMSRRVWDPLLIGFICFPGLQAVGRLMIWVNSWGQF